MRIKPEATDPDQDTANCNDNGGDMSEKSGGILPFRLRNNHLEVMLVHPEVLLGRKG